MQSLVNTLRQKRWAHLFVVNLRILIGFAFLPAGLKKLVDQPFTDPANVGLFHDFLHVFRATGLFYQFVGGVQLVIALLLMTQTYATLGALIAVPVFTAIMVFCWSTATIFTSTMVTLMWCATIVLALWDLHTFRGALNLAPAPPPEDPPGVIDIKLWRMCGLGILVLYFATAIYAGGIYRPRGVELDNPAFYTLPTIAMFPIVTYVIERVRRRRRGHQPPAAAAS